MNTLAFYVHIPYCVRRCGYCDFNTYTPGELSITNDFSVTSRSYIDLLLREIEYAREISTATVVPTIFFGGGTPTLMESKDLGRVIRSIGSHFELAKDAEVTTEANPDTVTKEKLSELRAAGFNRISFGMQSAVPHVLAALDRTHNPENVVKATTWAREVGFDEVSVDLIYGTAGESISDWELTLDTALSLPITHISAYALIVESGTKLGAQVKRGEVVMPDDDQTADKYLLADEKFSAAGFDWYELSNWSKPGSECRHNIAYWNGDNWWGAGAGAHSHIDGRRFWNVKHPAAYTQKVLESGNPMHDQEILTADESRSEEIMLQIRLASGIPLASLSQGEQSSLPGFLADGYLLAPAWEGGSVVLSQTGRLIADRIVREILL
jgi:putative oxygen-independent coproporphyrinogen III oxidase